MGKFNKKPTLEREILRRLDLVENKEGGIAFEPTAKTDLTLRLLTYLVGEPKFYDNSTEDQEIRDLIASVAQEDPEYLMKLAMYARNEMYLRSSPVFLLVESVAHDSVKPYVRNATPNIIKRADELTETIAYFIQHNGEIGSRGKASLPNSLKSGLADSFHNFDAYQFAKYDKNGEVKLRDVIRLVHPKPRNEKQSELFKQVRERTVPTPETWEVVVSAQGSTKEAWESITHKMGYMAKLRNLRNFLKVGANLDPVIEYLTKPENVRRSRQFPFRFFAAHKAVESLSEGDLFDRQRLLVAIEKALELSVENIPKWKGRTFVTADNSGSMEQPISNRSNMQCIHLANVMGALAHRISETALASVFATEFSLVNINPNDTVISNTQKMLRVGRKVGGSTYAYLVLDYLINHEVDVDRILIFSDMQCYGPENRWSYWGNVTQSLQAQLKRYKRLINPNVYLYSFDLVGYGTLQFPENESNICLLAGWSDRVFDFIKSYEEFDKGLIDRIENYSLD